MATPSTAEHVGPDASGHHERVAGAPPVRALHLINGEHYAGAERVQDLLALRLPDQGFEVGFACVKPGRFAERREAQSAPLHELPMRSRWDLRPAVALARLVRQEGYALLHSHTPRTVLVGRVAAALAGVPLVHHIHSQTDTEVGRPWTRRLNALAERASLVGVAAVIAVSGTAQAYARRQSIPERRIHLVANGIPVLGPLTERAPPDREWTLGTVALLRPRKGLEVLLEALARLRASGIVARLRVVGPFETEAYQREVERHAARLGLEGAVEWSGFTRNVNAELARMDVFVFPSVLAEGLPMVLLEAMAGGVPIVASRVDGVIDVLEDGTNALLVPPSDPKALAAAIGRFVDGLADWPVLRQRAWQRQRDCFSDRSMAAGVAAVYREVLSR